MRTTTNFHMNDTNHLITPEHLVHDKNLSERENSKKVHIDINNDMGDSYCKVYKPLDVKKSYKAIFGTTIAEFNVGKKPSKCKTIESYMSEIVNDKRGRRHKIKDKDGHTKIAEDAREGKSLYYEIVVSAGNSESHGAVQYDVDKHTIQPEQLPREVQTRVQNIYYKTFQARNPNMILIGYAIHGDEIFKNRYNVYNYSTIHSHGCAVPVAEFHPTTDKNGRVKHPMRLQNSMNKALAAMGLKSYEDWVKREQAYLDQITVQVYKDYCRDKKISDDIEIYHPVTAKNRLGGMSQTQFQAQQALNEKEQALAAEREQLDSDRKKLDDERELLDADRKKLTDERKQMDADRKKLDDERNRLDEDRKKLASERKQIDAIKAAQSKAKDIYGGLSNALQLLTKRAVNNDSNNQLLTDMQQPYALQQYQDIYMAESEIKKTDLFNKLDSEITI